MLPRSQWAVLIHGHHEGYLDWPTFEANQQRLGTNTRPQPHKPGGALREGAALLQGLATCGHCGRKLRTHYRGQQQAPGYHCADKSVVDGRGVYCLNVGGVQIDEAVAKAFLAAIAPAGLNAAVRAAEQLQADQDGALAQDTRDGGVVVVLGQTPYQANPSTSKSALRRAACALRRTSSAICGATGTFPGTRHPPNRSPANC
jgi:hypothetical protein